MGAIVYKPLSEVYTLRKFLGLSYLVSLRKVYPQYRWGHGKGYVAVHFGRVFFVGRLLPIIANNETSDAPHEQSESAEH